MADLKKANFWKTYLRIVERTDIIYANLSERLWCLHNLQEQRSYVNKIFNIIKKLIPYFKSLE